MTRALDLVVLTCGASACSRNPKRYVILLIFVCIIQMYYTNKTANRRMGVYARAIEHSSSSGQERVLSAFCMQSLHVLVVLVRVPQCCWAGGPPRGGTTLSSANEVAILLLTL